MISEYISLLISPHAQNGAGDFEKEYGGLLERAKNFESGGGKAHIIVSDDIILPVKLAFKKAEGVEISVCDFTSLAAIDRAVRKNTVLAYCEYPSAEAFRSHDFEKISEFLNYFKIKLACGLYFADPHCCGCDGHGQSENGDGNGTGTGGQNAAAENKIGGHFIKISRNAAIAKKIHEILSGKSVFKGLKITRVNSSKYIDYKNNRKLSKIDGCYIKIDGGDAPALKAAFDSLCAALDGSGFIKGELGGKIDDYYQLVRDYDNCRVYSISSNTASERSGESAENENDISGFIIKAGISDTIIDKLNEM